MNHAATWILVANASHAKLFRLVQFPKIEPLDSFEHPESRQKVQDFETSRQGQNYDRGGITQHSYQSHTNPKDMEMDKFAKLIGNHLSKSHQNKGFSKLYIIASPSFLGLLRHHLDPKMHNCIVKEIAKDMTEYDAAAIERYLQEI